MEQVTEQPELQLMWARDWVELIQADVGDLPTFGDALDKCQRAAKVPAKEIMLALSIDEATWSRYKSNNAAISGANIKKLEKLCGNDAPTIWLAWQGGKELRVREDEKDRRIRELEDEIAKKDSQHEYLVGVLKEIKG